VKKNLLQMGLLTKSAAQRIGVYGIHPNKWEKNFGNFFSHTPHSYVGQNALILKSSN
jgi:hypothetical protein